MKIILLCDVANLGKKNDIVEVSDGYATNFLIKTKKAVAYTKASVDVLADQLHESNEQHIQEVYQANLLKKQIESKEYVFYLKSNQGNVFGHISAKQLIDKINEQEKLVNKYMLKKEHEWNLGYHHVDFQVHKEVVATVKMNVLEQK